MPRVRKDKKKLKKIKRTRKQKIEKAERKEQEKQNNITVSVNSSGGSGGSSSNQHMPSGFHQPIDIKNSLLEALKGYVINNEPRQPKNMGSDEHDMMEMKNLDRFIQEPSVIFQNSPSPFAPNVSIPSLADLAKNNYIPLNAQQPEDYEAEFREEEEEEKPKRGRKRVIRTPAEEEQHKQDKKENSRLKRERKKEEKIKRERDGINNL